MEALGSEGKSYTEMEFDCSVIMGFFYRLIDDLR